MTETVLFSLAVYACFPSGETAMPNAPFPTLMVAVIFFVEVLMTETWPQMLGLLLQQ
jgi:hypothetical protein